MSSQKLIVRELLASLVKAPVVSAGKIRLYLFQLVSETVIVLLQAVELKLDSNNNPITQIMFRDLFPISLQGLDFEISSGNTDYMVGIGIFRYKDYIIESAETA